MGYPDENDQSGYDRDVQQEPSTRSDSVKDVSKTKTNEISKDRENGPSAASWKPGALRQFPVYGIMPLLLSIACKYPSILILSTKSHCDISHDRLF